MIAFYDPAVPARAPPAGVGFVSTVELRENDLAGFTETMRKLISVGDFSGLKNMTSREAWAQFQPIFRITAPFQAYLPAFQAYLVNTFDILSRDGSQHVEIRAALGNGTFGGKSSRPTRGRWSCFKSSSQVSAAATLPCA